MSLVLMPVERPLVIGHRGAPGYRPEHTLASYRQALRLGADRIELDVVLTRDGVLVARHEDDLRLTTDIRRHPHLADRRRAGDLTLAEVKSLRALERMPHLRPENARYDRWYDVPTLDEVLELVEDESRRGGRPVGVHVEVKEPHRVAAHDVTDVLLATLDRHGLDHALSPVLLQSFDPGLLRDLARRTEVPLVQLVGAEQRRGPLLTPTGLAGIASYAVAVGVHHELVLPRDSRGVGTCPTSLVVDAHGAGLAVHAWTLRDENHFLPTDHRRGTDPAAVGDGRGAARDLLACGVDALVADAPDTAAEAVSAWWDGQPAVG
jgi:glycerophosphoryl diester phosphodiesterase